MDNPLVTIGEKKYMLVEFQTNIFPVEYDKEYYSDGDLKPEENILFMIKIKSFGEITSIPITKKN